MHFMNHELHQHIGQEIKKIKKKNLEYRLDKACGGQQYVSLFLDSKDRKNAMCKVDAMLIYNNQIQVIIEIEESGLNPTKICGKYLASELSGFYERGDEKKIPFCDNPSFIQIIDITGRIGERYSKKDQAKKIEKKIQEKCKTGKIKQYYIFCIDGKDDKQGTKDFIKCLKNIIVNLA